METQRFVVVLATGLAVAAGAAMLRASPALAQETDYTPGGPTVRWGGLPADAPATPPAVPPASADQVPPTNADAAVPPAPTAPAPSDSLARPSPYGTTAPPPGYGQPFVLGQSPIGRPLDAYDGSLHLPVNLTARMRALDRDLMAVGVRGSTNIIDGVISLVAGAALLTVGIVFDNDPSVATGGLSTFLYVSGSALLARAAVEFFVEPNPLEPAVHYAHMPMRDRAEVDLRLHYGEEALSSLASHYQWARILESSISIASAVGLCLAYYIPHGFNTDDAVAWIVAISAGISVVTGLATLLTRSDAERRWDAYREMRDHLANEDVQLGVAPIPGGAAATASGHF